MKIPLLILVYYNGRAIDEEAIKNGVSSNSPIPKSMVIKRNMTLHSLKKKIHSKLSLLKNEYVYRIPQSLSSTKWTIIEINEEWVNV